MAHEISPDFGDVQKAAVRFPPAPPADRQPIVGPSTVMSPVGRVPVRFPTKATSWSRAARGYATGQGWPGRQVPSFYRASMPALRLCGPSDRKRVESGKSVSVGVALVGG